MGTTNELSKTVTLNCFFMIGTKDKRLRFVKGFSLAEVIATLTIGSMILVAVFGIYNHASKSADAVTEKLKSSNISSEILQRIAEDIDNVIALNSSETKITIQNKFDQGYPTSRMIIEKDIYDEANELKTFKKIIWQSTYDFESSLPGLVIYRSHSGMDLEEKLLDKQKQDWQRELFIPICEGVTFFRMQARKDNETHDTWQSQNLPDAVIATISFAEPFETLDGTFNVFDEDKTRRTIVIDRTRRIGFTYVTQYDLELTDVNDVNDANETPTNAPYPDDVND